MKWKFIINLWNCNKNLIEHSASCFKDDSREWQWLCIFTVCENEKLLGT